MSQNIQRKSSKNKIPALLGNIKYGLLNNMENTFYIIEHRLKNVATVELCAILPLPNSKHHPGALLEGLLSDNSITHYHM